MERTQEPERRKTLVQKIEAPEVRERKPTDVSAKHHLRASLSLLNAAVITQPKVLGRGPGAEPLRH